MKKIIITGKHNVDKLNKNKKSQRLVSESWDNSCNLTNENKDNQIVLLNRLYLNDDYDGIKYVKREVERKIK